MKFLCENGATYRCNKYPQDFIYKSRSAPAGAYLAKLTSLDYTLGAYHANQHPSRPRTM